MALRTLKDIELAHKRVLVRVDFNVPLKNGKVMDDTRIRAALPTIEEILAHAPRYIVLLTHVGRPKGTRIAELSVKPIAEYLGEMLGRDVIVTDDCVGPQVQSTLGNVPEGSIVMLENLRFHEQETKNDDEFTAELARYGDCFISDAFGTVHRAHASTVGIAKRLPSAAGLLIQKEVEYLRPVLNNPDRPLVAIIGGAKISSKIGILSSLTKKVAKLIIGGGMEYTFLTAGGHSIGKSLVETNHIDTAAELLEHAKKYSHLELILPFDHLVVPADAKEEHETETTIDVNIPATKKAVDIGPQTVRAIMQAIKDAHTIFWNGPMGIFEIDSYAQGTMKVARLLARSDATTIVGGGDSIAAINTFNLSDEIDHISTGGGASIEYLEGKMLPGIAALEA